jgi:uncharacterized protein YndB with AHSA1/START domain
MTATRARAVLTLPSETQILITREFAAPRALVWRAYTEPELIARWWTGERGEIVSVDVDLRVGGRWRYVMTANAGFEVAFHGEFRELDAPARLVRTEVFEGMPDAEALEDTTLTEAGGRTTLAVLVTHSCRAHRDAHVDSGMEDGLQEALDKLEAVAAHLAST